MKSLYLVLFLICAAGAAGLLFMSEPQREATDNGPYPSDWFMLQRAWPEPYLDPEKVLRGAEQAARLRRNTLDEDPFWVRRGPTNIGGRLTDIVGHPTDDNTVYIASAAGGVFKTTDGGLNWFPITDDFPTPSIGALAIDPSNPNTVYCGTGEANSANDSYFGSGIYKSTNGGSTWNNIGLVNSRFIARIVVHPEDPTNIWVASMGELFTSGGERGVYLSEDGGQSWTQKLFVNDSTGASDVVVHPTDPNIVYAATWQRIRGPEHRYVGGRGSGVYKSVNRGETWTRLSSGLPLIGDEVGRVGLAISQSNPSVLYAIYADDPGYFLGLFRSNDAGESWTQVNDEPLMDIFSSFGWYFGNIRVRPDDEDVIFALGVELFRSTNGGTTWTAIGELNGGGAIHVDHHALWFDPQQPFRFWLGCDGGLYRSTNNGNTFDDFNNFPVIQYYAGTYDAQQPHRLYGGTQDNGTLRSLSGDPHSFERIYGGDGFYTIVDPSNNNYVYAEYQYGGLGRSSDGGTSFDWALDGVDDAERRNWNTPVVLDPSNPQIVYYGTERLYRSTNRAQSWTPISPDLTDGGGQGILVFGTITAIGVSPVNSQVIYCGTDDANVWVTVNGGASWSRIDDDLPERWVTRITPHFANDNEALLTISGYRNAEQNAHLFRTIDFGQSWQELGAALPDVPLNDALYDPEYPSRIFVASDFGIFWSADYGGTWSPLGRGMPPVSTHDLVFDPQNRRLHAATHGRSFMTLHVDSLPGNRPPVISERTPASPLHIELGAIVDFSVTASDPDEDSLTFSWQVDGVQFADLPQATHLFADTGHFVVSILVSDTQFTISDTVLVRVDTSSLLSPTGALPDDFSLSAYPNPFNNETRFVFALPQTSPVELNIYSITGSLVADLNLGQLPAGRHEIPWSPQDLASGTYFVSLDAGPLKNTLKVHYLR
ncbi:MAG: PKD domain-containing protein [bacterium]|nr:PKD domain-containing protein [bacterium]